MDFITGIVVLAAVVGVIMFFQNLMGKAAGFGMKTVSQKVLYRTEHQEGSEIVNGPLLFETTSPPAKVMAEIVSRVTSADQCPTLIGGLYTVDHGDGFVRYAFGNKLVPTSFEAIVSLEETEAGCSGLFAVLAWNEEAGIVTGLGSLQRLRREVSDAFAAIDPEVKVTRGTAQLD